MAMYFSLVIECYREVDAFRIKEGLESLVLCLDDRRVPMANLDLYTKSDFWYVTACPVGPGYSNFGFGEGMNEPAMVARIIDELYLSLTGENGIRRALCGYEVHDVFEDERGEAVLNRFDFSDLIYHRDAAEPQPGAQEFGREFYRNLA
ncbi:hypothetical protein [Verrucomicrobium sp. BvORR106]|uniref:hypothetical protein n=1 Tax=Verrucomicrobium sp. BvORR106 TaxID=1403819 RepID=UPI00057115B5|nr:hypothetical protein [Verrucomicrobium sp. BvORR106]